MADNLIIQCDDDVLTIDDLTVDLGIKSILKNELTPKIDLNAYLVRRASKKTKCSYCSKIDLYINGLASNTAKNNPRDRNEAPVWFCCECCSSMYKHETGVVMMPNDCFQDTLKRAYGPMYKKRYAN